MKLNEPLPKVQAALIKAGVMISARLTLLSCGIVNVNTIDLRDEAGRVLLFYIPTIQYYLK